MQVLTFFDVLVLVRSNISGTEEGDTATDADALFAAHPSMSEGPSENSWFISKFDVSDLWLIDAYGGASDLGVVEFFSLNPFTFQ